MLQDSVSYLYLIYLLSGYQRGKPNSLNLIDIMNVGAALGNLGYFQEGYDYLHFLDCHKMIKKPALFTNVSLSLFYLCQSFKFRCDLS